MTRPERVLTLLALWAKVRVRVCGLCGSLVVVGGREQHDRWHSEVAR